MDGPEHSLHLSTSLIITMIIISLSLGVLAVAQAIPKTASEQYIQTNKRISEAEYTKYEGIESTGSDVVSALRKSRNSVVGIEVVIKTTDGLVTITSNDITASFQNLPTNKNYINPSAKFTCELIRKNNDAADSIIKMKFTQVKYVPVVSNTLDGSQDNIKEEGAAPKATSSIEPTSSPAGDEATTKELDIIFSDNVSDKVVEEMDKYTELNDEIKKYASELESLESRFCELDVETTTKGEVELLLNDLKRIKTACNNLQISYTNEVKSNKSDTNIENSLSSLNNEIASLLKQLEEFSKLF